MKVELVQDRRIQAFRQRFGDGHFYLACHAALPLALTPDLLYRLWAAFQRDSQDHDLAMPWIAVSDLLLSGLCAEVGHELYEMERAVRDELMHQLKASPRLGLARVREVAEFVIAYSAPQLESADLDTRDFAQAQQWRSLAYKNPQEAARTIATTLAGLSFSDTHEWIRLAALVETLEEPLAEFPVLLEYVGAICDLAKGNERSAAAKLSQILDATNRIQVVDVNLPLPAALQKAAPQTQSSNPNVKRHPSRINAIRPYANWLIGGGLLAAMMVSGLIFYNSQTVRSPLPVPSVVSSTTPSPLLSQSSPSVYSQVGNVGESVYILQQRLRDHLYTVPLDGVFDEQTAEAVQQFQKDTNLPVDGIVGPETWFALSNQPGTVSQRYVVLIPMGTGVTLGEVRRVEHNAFEQRESQLGPYIHVAAYGDLDQAQRKVKALKSQGFDAQVQRF